MRPIRIDRFLANQGKGSRKEVRTLLKNGRVRINTAVVTNSEQKVDPEKETVFLDGHALIWHAHLYLMMNKPAGVISANRDPKAKTVLDLLPSAFSRPGLFPAGRLDKDTEGFLLITDDGVFAHEILSPRRHVEKLYCAQLDASVTPSDVEAFSAGMILEDGFQCQPAKMWAGKEKEAFTVLREGKFHQVRRMFAMCGKRVLHLRRLQIGAVVLDVDLKPGEVRELTESEKKEVKKSVFF
ncbi:MAG TPA: 16S rRNA pseudouridine(516) synthase [Ruminococcaceae bacterium]|nr:16S rRNA pseudouridine(516) synthase [Oscillospiraceae bacterium]